MAANDDDCEGFDEENFETNCRKLEGYCATDFSVSFE